MKAGIAILVVIGLLFTVWKLFDYWDKMEEQRMAQERAEQREQYFEPRQLAGVPNELEASLDQAYKAGPRALKAWIVENKKKNKVEDPRLAWIELDYVVQISTEDPVDARKVFADVKARTPTSSRVYNRVKQLSKTFE